MKITVIRYVDNGESTLSLVFVDEAFQCYGLEDTFYEVKIPGLTRIPAGVYKIKVRRFGGTHEVYRERFSSHKGMLEICNVPDFTDVLIHIGNTSRDTAGCLLVGGVAHMKAISESRVAYLALYEKVIAAAEDGNLEIEFTKLGEG